MAARDRLTKTNGAQASMQINPPPVRVKMPEIKVPAINIPEIKIPEIQVPAANVDMAPVAAAIEAIGGAIVELGQQQIALAQQHAELVAAIKELAQPQKSAKSARSYTVDFDRQNGETVGMRVKVG